MSTCLTVPLYLPDWVHAGSNIAHTKLTQRGRHMPELVAADAGALIPLRGVALTARWIAHERWLESRRLEGERLFEDPLARALGGEDGERYSEGIKANAADGPGDPSWPEWHRNWVAVRTAEIDERCAAALDAENRSEAATITQVVNLGAGLDARAFRGLGRRANGPSFAGCDVFEVDFEDVLRAKALTAAALGVAPRAARYEAVAADVTDALEWTTAVRAAGFDPARPALFLGEGLLCYLPARRARAVLEAAAELAAPGSVWIGDWHTPESHFSAALGATRRAVAKSFEHAGWGAELRSFGEDEALRRGRFPEHKAPFPGLGIVHARRGETKHTTGAVVAGSCSLA